MFHILTVVFVVLKVLAIAPVAAWSWWLVLAPSLGCIAFALLMFALAGIFTMMAQR